ncbi:hypothetical protein [Sphingobium cloacae]|uniref:Uncharacterized protein n=1 Tax=Sphingobium cloacae TaxID=120107 RepID=A0A1E1EYL6_9SPHN|nr:hypothetical protein [Sphingobium cloacae]BAV63357.1 hypothetical protein SCLO_1003170 [Sphingobium cloacae]
MKFAKTVLLAAAFMPFASHSSIAKTQQASANTQPASTSPQQAGATNTPQTAEPNITGVWEIWPDPFAPDPVTGEENTFLELPVPGDGPKLKEPYASEWKAIRAERDAKLKAGTPLADPNTLCIPEGMPSVMGAIFPLQILQTPGQITVLAEFLTQTRRIYLNRKMPPLEDITPGYYGMSTAKWEGDTLVVTTKGVKEDVRFFEIPHSDEMTITERIRLTAPNLIENKITIEDPKMLQEPYTFTYGYKRNDEYEMSEYFCEKEDPLFKVGEDGTVQMKTGEEVK